MKKKLGEILFDAGSVRPEDLQDALDAQNNGDPSRLGDLLVANGKVTTVDMARALAVQFGLPFVSLDQVSPDVAALVPIGFQTLHGLVPFKDDGPGQGIHVAVADPSVKDLLAELELQIGRPLIVSIASPDEIASVHAALQGDVVEAAIVEDDPPPSAPTMPIAIPDPVPSKPSSLGRVALKRVAVNTVTGEVTPVKPPSVAADLLDLELPSRPVTRPRAVMPEPPAEPEITSPMVAPLIAPLATPASGLPARARRPLKTEPAAPPVLKPNEPSASPKRPKTVTGLKKAVADPGTTSQMPKLETQGASEATAMMDKLDVADATIRAKVPSKSEFAKAAAMPLPEATVALSDLPAWMSDGGLSTSADPLTAAVEKAVLVGGAPRVVARVLRLLVERGLLTERELLEELERP